jgi:hypothetical protein
MHKTLSLTLGTEEEEAAEEEEEESNFYSR